MTRGLLQLSFLLSFGHAQSAIIFTTVDTSVESDRIDSDRVDTQSKVVHETALMWVQFALMFVPLHTWHTPIIISKFYAAAISFKQCHSHTNNLFQFPAIFCRPLLVRPICDNFQWVISQQYLCIHVKIEVRVVAYNAVISPPGFYPGTFWGGGKFPPKPRNFPPKNFWPALIS